MKYLKILPLLLLPLFAAAQPLGTWPVQYGDTPPTHTPSGSGTRIYLNISSNELWNWNPAPASSWVKYPKGFDQISGCSAPGYTPTARQSVFAVNSCTALQNGRGPELYQYTGSQWVCLNCYPAYTAGTGIGISSGVITNTAPDQVVSISGVGITPSGTYPNFTLTAADQSASNELNTSFQVTGSNLALTDAGGTINVPVSSIAPVQAVAAGSGISISGTTTRTITAADASPTNELQTLSIDGSDLTLSNGGGTVTLPGGASGAISVTYSQLVTDISGSDLIPGQWYLISDFHTRHTIPGTGDANIGDTEPILVLATAPNAISPQAFSTIYPDDIIYYKVDNATSGNIFDSDKGIVFKRIDTKQDNVFTYDFRAVKFRRWQISVSSLWDSGTTYSKGDAVITTENEIFISQFFGNTANDPYESFSRWWRKFEWNNGDFASPTPDMWSVVGDAVVFNVPCSPSFLYEDYPTFSTPENYTSFQGNRFDGGDWLTNTVFYGSAWSGNSFGAAVNSNSIGQGFKNNSIGQGFENNSIGQGFESNDILASFAKNSISPLFSTNKIGYLATSNSIGQSFYGNTVAAYFSGNSLASAFAGNTIEESFIGNFIGVAFSTNRIGYAFARNTILAFFKHNTVSYEIQDIDFTGATHVYNTFDKTIFYGGAGPRLYYFDASDVLTVAAITD